MPLLTRGVSEVTTVSDGFSSSPLYCMSITLTLPIRRIGKDWRALRVQPFGTLGQASHERSARMLTATGKRIVRCLILAILFLSGSAGCAVLSGQPDPLLQQQVADPSGAQPMVVVELRDGDSDKEYLRAPWTETMVVQDALKGSGAIHRFRHMHIVLVRETPSGQKLRLPVQYDASKRRVVESNNYAMHPGDWLEVTRDTRTVFDRMIKSALEPLQLVCGPRRIDPTPTTWFRRAGGRSPSGG